MLVWWKRKRKRKKTHWLNQSERCEKWFNIDGDDKYCYCMSHFDSNLTHWLSLARHRKRKSRLFSHEVMFEAEITPTCHWLPRSGVEMWINSESGEFLVKFVVFECDNFLKSFDWSSPPFYMHRNAADLQSQSYYITRCNKNVCFSFI